MRPNQEFYHLLRNVNYELTVIDSSSTHFDLAAATSSSFIDDINTVPNNGVMASGTSRLWNFGDETNHATDSGVGFDPIWKANIMNSKPVVGFTHSNGNQWGGFYFDANVSGTSSVCIMWVLQVKLPHYTSPTLGNPWINIYFRDKTNANRTHQIYITSSTGGGDVFYYGAISGMAKKVTSMGFSNVVNLLVMYNNGVLRANGSTGSDVAGTATSLTAGTSEMYANLDHPDSSGSFANVGEIIFWDRNLTTSEQSYVEGYLKTKWGISY